MVFAAISILLVINRQLADCSYADVKANGGAVKTAEELNTALGGGHKVDGNTVYLQDNVMFEKDVNITMDDVQTALTIEANGKTVSGEGAIFILKHSALILSGDGTYTAAGNDGIIIAGEASQLTVTGGTFKSGNAPVIKMSAGNKKWDSPDMVTLNGGDFGEYSIEAHDAGTLNLVIYGNASLGKVSANTPAAYDYNDQSDPHRGADSHKIVVKDGQVAEIKADDTRVEISGGSVGNGGIHGYEWKNSNVVMSGGVITGPVDISGKLNLKGGTIRNSGCTVGAFDISKGTIISSGSFGLKCWSGKTGCKMTGGTVKTTRKGASGIVLMYKKALTLSGGTLKGNGGTGIFVKGASKKEYGKKLKARLNLSCRKGSKAVIKGYKKAIYGKKGQSKVTISKNTVLKAKKKTYRSSSKLPRSLAGNVVVKYR